jgi:hypothetical protein
MNKLLAVLLMLIVAYTSSYGGLFTSEEEKEKKRQEEALKSEIERQMRFSSEIYGNLNSLLIMNPVENLYTITLKEDNLVNTFNIKKNTFYILDVGVKGNLLFRESEQADLTKYSKALMLRIPPDDTKKLEVYNNGQKYSLGVKDSYAFEMVYLVTNRSSISKLSIKFNGVKDWKK